jgi:hypothetical protein
MNYDYENVNSKYTLKKKKMNEKKDETTIIIIISKKKRVYLVIGCGLRFVEGEKFRFFPEKCNVPIICGL